MPMFPLSLAVLALPAAEIAGFIVVGGRIGVLATLGLVALGMLAGVLLLRWQGTQVLARIRSEMEAGRLPGAALIDAAMLLLAAALLIVPGFVTDAAGLLLFLPPLRHGLARLVLSRLQTRMTVAEAGGRPAVELSPEEWRREPGPGNASS